MTRRDETQSETAMVACLWSRFLTSRRRESPSAERLADPYLRGLNPVINSPAQPSDLEARAS